MIAIIEMLIATSHAYEAQGHVLFSVASMKDYGKLSRRSQDELLAGARIDVAPYKRDPGDFVLWKPSTPELPGWESPWGRGRPGWHIECSAMAETFLGETFDIHGGGLDLIFPHHENEIAQSECAHGGKPLARYWPAHNAFVNFEGEKMSKSLGNFRTIRDVLAQGPGEAARLAMLTAHYRDPLDFTAERLAQAKQTLDRYYLALRGVGGFGAGGDVICRCRCRRRSEDDLNTPLALTELHKILAGSSTRPRAPPRRPGSRARCWQAAWRWACCSRIPRYGCAATPMSPPASRPRSPPATPRAKPRTSPKPTASAPTSPSRVSCSKTSPTAPRSGEERADHGSAGNN